MLDERQKRLISDYGPRFYRRSSDIQDEFLHLMADASSVLADSEVLELSKTVQDVVVELKKASTIVYNRMKEAGLPVR